MMKKQNFKRRLIASAVASTALAGMGNLAFAQSDEDMLEEVVVTGIRASLERSMDIKRDSQGVVDAISAEDIGKFPDSNLAESLQRITGVSINRSNGEGSKVTVRGFGPDYNLVTLNGRQMPGTTIEATSVSGSRSFDFSNIASEGISGVEVYKTVRAENPAGGVGATINIKTARPLENPGQQLSVGVKGVYDDSAADPSLTPEISGLYSNTFADDKFGVGLSFSYQDREGGNANSEVGTGWRYFEAGAEGWGAITNLQDTDFHTNPPSPEDGDLYAVPQQTGYSFNEYERTRINGQLVLQYAPTDDIVATMDYTYSKKEESSKFSDVGAWFNFGANRRTSWTDAGAGVVESPLMYEEFGLNGADLTFGAGYNASVNENDSLGLNVEWTVTDRLTLEFDAHASEAESKPDSPYGNSNVITTSAFLRDSSAVYLGQDLPVLNVGVSKDVELSDLQITGSSFRNARMVHEIDQFQFKGNFEFTDQFDMDFGVSRIEQSNRSTFANNQRDTWGGLGNPGDVPMDGYTLDDIGSYFDNVSGHDSENLLGFRYVADFDKVVQYAADNLDDGGGFSDCANGSTYYCMNPTPDDVRIIEEDSNSAWVQLNMDTDIAGMRTRAALGVRWEDTETRSYATPIEDQFTGEVAWIGGNEMYLLTADDYSVDPVENGVGGYDYFLPSLDIAVDVLDDVVVRASYGRSLGRPLWNQMSALSVGRGPIAPQSMFPGTAGGAATRGNIDLKPILSDNFDLSVEWYYGDASYVSVGYYKKDVENFIGSTVTPEELFDAPDPSQGSRRDAAVAADPNNQWSTGAVRDYIVNNTEEGEPGVDFTKFPSWVLGLPGDPNVIFNVTEFVNQDNASFDGWEFAVQHTFWDTGFGVVANYTIAESDTSFDDNDIANAQFALTGLSDTANFIAFYEKNGVQLRVSYNWRDQFLAGTADGTGANPTYVEDYSQIDVNASYDISENFTIFLEGINVTDEYGRNFGRTDLLTKGVYTSGPRYNIGARYTF
ncbi:TonB-dependent receptor [Gilvimarinus algae]|uniref:TonB-dependent receptor n=1 Tax=Gilvimarinus algae TaxID=3058037 RepID=A0ABT8TB04_9GAMM|nr:TonB-dependent receptor [Gilvimarinus sp. SDUM040014]MDO3381289.1 TonB-dependent receptor [Gilvimarinus sp. SDUM040014]